ncbi:unnamed protein product, partial [Didymodactylos carnosus]
MSDLRCLPKLSFGDIENYIRQKLNEICDGYETNDIQNSMIVVTPMATEIRVTSNVKHSTSKKNVCSIKIISKDLTVSDLKGVTANCDCKYGNSEFCSHVCSVLYRLASYQLLKYDYIPDSDFSTTITHGELQNLLTWPICLQAKRQNRSSELNIPFATILDHALQQQQLALVNTKFGPTYSISALALQQYNELGKEYTFCIDDYEQPTYPKNMDYPPFPLQPLPSLEELKLSHTNVWWPLDIVLTDSDCVSLEAQTVTQRANQMWRDAHSKRLSASQ